MFRKIVPYVPVLIIALLIFKGIDIFRQTFIPWYVLLLPIIAGPFLIFPLLRPLMRKMKENREGSWLMAVVYGAPLCYFLFLSVNFYIPQNDQSCTQTFRIVKKGVAATKTKGSGTPFVNIIFAGRKKQLFFSRDEKAAIDAADSIGITYRQGLLGFKTIRNYRFR